MLAFIKSYAITFILFLVIELVWLVVVAKNFYQKELGHLMKPQPSLAPTALFGLIFILGMVFFVINPAVEKNSWTYALFVGIFYGLITYSTYSLTNLATLESWPLKVSIVDLIWGGSLGAMVSTLSFFVIS